MKSYRKSRSCWKRKDNSRPRKRNAYAYKGRNEKGWKKRNEPNGPRHGKRKPTKVSWGNSLIRSAEAPLVKSATNWAEPSPALSSEHSSEKNRPIIQITLISHEKQCTEFCSNITGCRASGRPAIVKT